MNNELIFKSNSTFSQQEFLNRFSFVMIIKHTHRDRKMQSRTLTVIQL